MAVCTNRDWLLALRRLSMDIVEIAAMRSPPTSRGGKEKSAVGD